jgi:hypothetical protein
MAEGVGDRRGCSNAFESTIVEALLSGRGALIVSFCTGLSRGLEGKPTAVRGSRDGGIESLLDA